jgi:hypothetical protein
VIEVQRDAGVRRAVQKAPDGDSALSIGRCLVEHREVLQIVGPVVTIIVIVRRDAVRTEIDPEVTVVEEAVPAELVRRSALHVDPIATVERDDVAPAELAPNLVAGCWREPHADAIAEPGGAGPVGADEVTENLVAGR